MDRRNRKYYLVTLPYMHNECIKKLKEIRTVKIHIPYDFNKSTNWDMQIA